MNKEFNKYARLEHGISSMTMHRYESVLNGYINPTIIEERKLNVASMDVFSRLMMDRIIFLGTGIDDDVANIITAQLLFLASNDSTSDISLYLNTPGGQVSSGLSIYDTMQIIEPDVATICTGMAASMGSVLLCAGAVCRCFGRPAAVLSGRRRGAADHSAVHLQPHCQRKAEKGADELHHLLCHCGRNHAGGSRRVPFQGARGQMGKGNAG